MLLADIFPHWKTKLGECHQGWHCNFVVSGLNPAFWRCRVVQVLHVDPHCLYLGGRGWMDRVRVVLQGGAPVHVSVTPWDAQQRDRKHSQMEGGEAAERMLWLPEFIQRLLGHSLGLPCSAKLLAWRLFVQTGWDSLEQVICSVCFFFFFNKQLFDHDELIFFLK